jgi:predicted AAA+ superfamily ATPase
MITRKLQERIKKQLANLDLPRGVILYGPRQVGKTTLVQAIVRDLGLKTLVLNGDLLGSEIKTLCTRDIQKIKLLLSGYEMLVIDEAQRIEDIGIIAKIVMDFIPNLKVILTGSAALDLASRVSEPLTGRAYSYHLWPLSQQEYKEYETYAERLRNLEQRIVYGNYPKVNSLEGQDEKREYLTNLIDKYLYKDILEFGGMRNSSKIRDLLRLLAYQIGNQVSIAELAARLEISRDTVNNYIHLLEASFVIFRLHGFSRNLRKEMRKMDKIYFWDTGVRNALLNQYAWLAERLDSGALWENFMIVERLKRNEYEGWGANHYFWRLNSGAELDLIEERGSMLTGIEIKQGNKYPKLPDTFKEAYPDAKYRVVNIDNWNEWVVEE